MPIEIRELIIRAKMDEAGQGAADLSESGLQSELEAQQMALFQQFKEQTIKECMESLQKLLKKQKQR